MTAAGAPGRLRLTLFAFGDFAFNLYWQSVMLFLLFYYTDAVGLSIGVAATIFTVASIWDGFANFAAGAIADRRGSARAYAAVLTLGSVPLALSFILTYMAPPASAGWGTAFLLGGHLLFRTAYGFVNVTYLAMSARISTRSDDRAFIAGMRMLFGTAAAVLVALTTVPLGAWITGSSRSTDAYSGAALLFALVGTVVLVLTGLCYREGDVPPGEKPSSLRQSLRSLMRNRAFVTLNLAMMAMIVAMTVLNKSVLYYFKYRIGDESAGQLALAAMGIASAAAIPLWMLLSRPLGLRALWFAAAGAGTAGLAAFAAFDIDHARLMHLFLIGMQMAVVGLNFVFWAMLPNTIEYGERVTGFRVEGVVFGLAALLQRVAIGIATAILGLSFGAAGYVANVEQTEGTLTAMRLTIALVPLFFLIVSCALMLLNPLGRGTHAAIVEELRHRKT